MDDVRTPDHVGAQVDALLAVLEHDVLDFFELALLAVKVAVEDPPRNPILLLHHGGGLLVLGPRIHGDCVPHAVSLLRIKL